MVWEVIDALVVGKRLLQKVFSDPVLVDPRHIPVSVALGLGPSFRLEEVVYGVAERSSEAYLPRSRRHFGLSKAV